MSTVIEQAYYDTFSAALLELFSPMKTRDGKSIKVLPDKIKDQIFGDQELVERFIRYAFTTSSYDFDANYESDETVGDLYVNAITGDRAIECYPSASPSELTNMIAYYKSNQYLKMCIISVIPNIKQLIREDDVDNMDDKVYGDIFEALIRVTFVIVREIQRGLEYSAIELLYTKLTAKYPMSREYARANSKSLVTEFLGNLAEKPSSEKQHYSAEEGLKVYIPRKLFVERLLEVTDRKDVIDVWLSGLPKATNKNGETSVVFESGKIGTRALASTAVYDKILKFLTERNITEESWENARFKKVLEDYAKTRATPQESNYTILNKFETQRLEKNYKSFYFTKKDTAEGDKLWSLIGVTEKGKRQLIGRATSSSDSRDFHKAKYRLFDKFLQIEEEDNTAV